MIRYFKKPFRIAYVSTSVTGILAAVESGLAIAPIGFSYMPKHLRALGPESGFSLLPSARIVLHQRSNADNESADFFCRHITAFFQTHP